MTESSARFVARLLLFLGIMTTLLLYVAHTQYRTSPLFLAVGTFCVMTILSLTAVAYGLQGVLRMELRRVETATRRIPRTPSR